MRGSIPRLRALLWALAVAGCGGAAEPPVRKTVFDPTAAAAAAGAAPVEVGTAGPTLEVPYPPLDRAEVKGGPAWVGVSVLRGGVRFSRPSNWAIRDASVDPGRAYIVYVSPNAYSFALYERSDAPTDLWRDVQARYENDVASAGAKVVGRRIPVATSTNQGRAYTVERKAPAASRSREYLLRSDHRVILVQVVSQDPDLSRLSAELLDILAHLEVL
jgi:hypothetical protein